MTSRDLLFEPTNGAKMDSAIIYHSSPRRPEQYGCFMCGGARNDYGNNPAPLINNDEAKKKNLRCCKDCNRYVELVRIEQQGMLGIRECYDNNAEWFENFISIMRGSVAWKKLSTEEPLFIEFVIRKEGDHHRAKQKQKYIKEQEKLRDEHYLYLSTNV